MEYNEKIIDNKRYLEIDYPIGRLCWFRDTDRVKKCGHLCGVICLDFESMIFSYCVNCCGKIYYTDKVYETRDEILI